jgi:hypothetical protein
MSEVENGGQQATESSPSPTEHVESTPVEPKSEPVVGAEEAKYEPSYKFKVQNEEKEFDEFLRGSVKTKADEEKLRDVYTKAYGLETYKKNNESWKDKVEKHYQPLESKHNQMMTSIGYLDQAVAKKDYQTFFDTLKIPKEDILKYALDLVKFEELPPEQKEAISQKKQVEHYNAMLSQQNQSAQSQVQEYAVQVRTMQLSNELMKPDIGSFVQSFDKKAGEGAFRNHVIRHANLAFYQNQMDLPVEQAVKEVMALYGNMIEPQNLSSQVSTPHGQARPPVIPNVQSSGNSPAKSLPRSIADLKKLAKQKASEE